MKLAIRRNAWIAFGFATILLLSACGSAVSITDDAESAVHVADPRPTTEPNREQLLPTAISEVESPTATRPVAPETPTATLTRALEDPTPSPTVAHTTTGTQDDRSRRLRAATSSWNTNWDLHIIDYDDLRSGGPPRDGIPSIDDPQFVSSEEASVWLADNEPVIALEIDNDARAYPLQILTWHEIVNDVVSDVPVIVTFCPLCNSAITFDRRLGSETYEFGTSGLLRNSDLVMYDRTTESLWQQFTGQAIVGDLVGEVLDFLPSSLVSFADFQQAYPQGIVLSRDTGFARNYGRNPYAGYDTIDQSPFLFDGETDERLSAMERVVTVSLATESEAESESGANIDVAYPLSVLSEEGVINDTQGEYELAIFHSPGTSSALGASVIAQGTDVGATGLFEPYVDGKKLTFRMEGEEIVDEQTGSTWNVLGQATTGPLAGNNLKAIVHGDHFWFAWAAFRPDTIIYEGGGG
jgi:hypothetical protein